MKAFTDYFGEVEEITMLAYDGNKYVDILRPNGEKTSIKRGYCFKNPSKYTKEEGEEFGCWKPKPQFFSKYVWWKLEGKRKEDFVAREKEWYSKYYCEDKKFKTRKDAIKFAIKYAKASDHGIIEVGKQNEVYYFECHSDGHVVMYDRSRRSLRHKGLTKPKWVRGYDRDVKWMKLPKGFFTIWLHMLGDSNSTWSNDGGCWDGIGKWVIYPKAEVKNMWEEE